MPLGNWRRNFDRMVAVVREWVGGTPSTVPCRGSLYQLWSVSQRTGATRALTVSQSTSGRRRERRHQQVFGIPERAECRRAGIPDLQAEPFPVPGDLRLEVPDLLRGVAEDRGRGNRVAQARRSGERDAAHRPEPGRQEDVSAAATAEVVLQHALRAGGKLRDRRPSERAAQVERRPARAMKAGRAERQGRRSQVTRNRRSGCSAGPPPHHPRPNGRRSGPARARPVPASAKRQAELRVGASGR